MKKKAKYLLLFFAGVITYFVITTILYLVFDISTLEFWKNILNIASSKY